MLYAFDKEVKVKAYSMEYRRLVAEAYDACGSSDDVAAEFKCSASWVRRLIQRRRETGSLEPLPPQQPDNRKMKEKECVRSTNHIFNLTAGGVKMASV